MPTIPNSIDEAANIILNKKNLLELKKGKTLEKEFKTTKKSKQQYNEYRIRRKQALYEENRELRGEENVSTKRRQAFFHVLKILYDLGESIPDKDVDIIKNAFYTHPDFIDKDKIRFVVEVANKNDGLDKADEVTSDMLSLLRRTAYYEPLQDFKKWIKREKLSAKIKQLRQKGLNNSQISEKLHITTAEVTVCSDTTKEMPTLFGDEER